MDIFNQTNKKTMKIKSKLLIGLRSDRKCQMDMKSYVRMLLLKYKGIVELELQENILNCTFSKITNSSRKLQNYLPCFH